LFHVQPEPRRETGWVFDPDRSGLPVSDGHLVPIEEHLDDALGRIFPGIVWREACRMDPVPAFLTCAYWSTLPQRTFNRAGGPTPSAPQTRHLRSGPGCGPASASPAAQ